MGAGWGPLQFQLSESRRPLGETRCSKLASPGSRRAVADPHRPAASAIFKHHRASNVGETLSRYPMAASRAPARTTLRETESGAHFLSSTVEPECRCSCDSGTVHNTVDR